MTRPEIVSADGSAPIPGSPLRRGLATLVDMVVFLACSWVLLWPVLSVVDWTGTDTSIEGLVATISQPTWLNHAAGMIGIWAGFWWAYFAFGWGLLGATPGKWLLGLRIVDYRQRCPIGLARATLRLAAYSVSSLTLCWGHLLPLLRGDRRALHDILAGTRVVRAPVPSARDRDRSDLTAQSA